MVMLHTYLSRSRSSVRHVWETEITSQQATAVLDSQGPWEVREADLAKLWTTLNSLTPAVRSFP